MITAPILGASPQTTRNTAPSVTTWRLITPVIAISPTFWLNVVFGIAPNTAASAVPTPSAQTAPDSSRSVARRPALPSQIASTSPIVSIDETNPVRQKPTIAEAEIAKPKWNGLGSITQPRRGHRGEIETRPIASASAYPASSPSSTAAVDQMPRPNRLSPTVVTTTTPASSQLCGAPNA